MKMAATKHTKEELLTGKQKERCAGNHRNNGACCGACFTPSGKVIGKRSVEGGDHAAQIEARMMSEAGDEQGCMKKAELKDMLGSKQASIARNLTHQEVPCNLKFPGFVHHKPAALDRELDVPS